MKEIPEKTLWLAAMYLDEVPSSFSKEPCTDEYWRQLIDALPRRIYSNAQIETFAEAILKPKGSPAFLLLLSLRERGLQFEEFVGLLKKIKCNKALNLFIQSTVPEVKRNPNENVSVKMGDTLVLACSAKCDPPSPQYQWHFNGVPLPDQRDSTLVIPNAHVGMTGVYRCKVSNSHITDPRNNFVWTNESFVEVVKLSVQEHGDEDVDMSTVHQPVTGISTSTMCSSDLTTSSSNPSSHPYTLSLQSSKPSSHPETPADVTRNNTLSSPSNTSLMSRGSGSVASGNVMSDNQIAQSPTNIQIVQSPTDIQIVQSPTDIQIVKGLTDIITRCDQQFTLECRAKSNLGKKLLFSWKMKGKVFHEEESYESSTWSEKYKRHATLNVSCAVTHADKGSTERHVEKAVVTIHNVWIVEQPKSVVGYPGEMATLTCRGEGKGAISYQWLKRSHDGDTFGALPYKTNSVLELYLDLEARGQYKCQPSCKSDFVSSDIVTVRFRPRNSKSLKISVQPLSVVCEKGKDATLCCVAAPEEGTQYQWFFNGSPMNYHYNTTSQTKDLVVKCVNDSHFGEYYCLVTNGREGIESRKVNIHQRKDYTPSKKPMAKAQLDQEKAEFEFVTKDGVGYARDKIALLIGNQEYDNFNNLTSPRNDIIKLKQTLLDMGFKVFAYFDLTFSEIMEVFGKICPLLGPGMNLLFYYSGHGFHHERLTTDYIMPVDVSKAEPLKCSECVPMNYINGQFQSTLCKVFAFYDCCRVSFKRDKILGPTESLTKSVAYSNLFQVFSCIATKSAYERRSEACSVFNKALRTGLKKKLNIVEQLHIFMSQEMKKESQSKNGSEFQRLEASVKMLTSQITLHEEVMIESWAQPAFDPRENMNLYDMQTADNKVSLVLALDGLAKSEVTFSFDALNCLVVKATHENRGQCRKMDTEITVLHDCVTVEKVPMDSGPCVYLVKGIQKVEDNQKTLQLNAKLSVEDASGKKYSTEPKPIDINLHKFNVLTASYK